MLETDLSDNAMTFAASIHCTSYFALFSYVFIYLFIYDFCLELGADWRDANEARFQGRIGFLRVAAKKTHQSPSGRTQGFLPHTDTQD